LQFFRIDEIVVSTYPGHRSGWLRAHLVERVQEASGLPVEHVVAESEAAKPATAGGAA
jgi:hypothetical protein